MSNMKNLLNARMREANMAHSKKHHGGKVKGFGVSAPGDAVNNGAPGPTPAPARKIAPDVISAPRQPSPGIIGSRAVSIPPGTQAPTPMAEVLRQDGDDGTLERIIREGTAKNDFADELRTVDASPIKAAHGMRSRTANDEGGKVPNKIG